MLSLVFAVSVIASASSSATHPASCELACPDVPDVLSGDAVDLPDSSSMLQVQHLSVGTRIVTNATNTPNSTKPAWSHSKGPIEDWAHHNPTLLALTSLTVVVGMLLFFRAFGAHDSPEEHAEFLRTFSVVAAVITFLVVGVLMNVIKDFMSSTRVRTGPSEDLVPRGFDYPVLWNFMTFTGMSCLLPMHLASKQEEKPGAEPSKQAPTHVFLVAMLLQWFALYIRNAVYKILPGSLVLMLGSSRAAFVCLLGYLALGKSPKFHQLAGVALALIGTGVAGASAVNAHEKASDLGLKLAGTVGEVSPGRLWCGTALCLLSELVRGTLYVYQEKVVKQYDTSAIEMAGMTGVFGFAFSSVALVIFHVMEWEDFGGAMYQLGHSPLLLVSAVLFFFTASVNQYLGISLTKMLSSLFRAMMELMTTAALWVSELLLRWDAFTYTQAAGFFILCLGCAIDARAIPITWLERWWTKLREERIEKEEKTKLALPLVPPAPAPAQSTDSGGEGDGDSDSLGGIDSAGSLSGKDEDTDALPRNRSSMSLASSVASSRATTSASVRSLMPGPPVNSKG